MKRFPSYKVVTEYEKKVKKGDDIDKLILNYIIQVLRRYEVTGEYNLFSDLEYEFSRNPRIKILDLSKDILVRIIEDYCKVFNRKNITKEGEIIHMFKTSSSTWDYESRGLNFGHYKNYGSYYDIFKRYKMGPHAYKKANSIYNRIQQILDSRFDYNIQVVKNGSIYNRNATNNSDCDILLKFPENFQVDYVNNEFSYIRRYLVAYGYRYISGWKTTNGSQVLRFKDHNSDFTIDIGYYVEILVSKTNLIRAYQNLHPDIYKAILLIKIWADRRQLNSPSTTQVINSYCHLLMFITYLIVIKAIPNLRTISPKLNLWKAGNLDYYPIVEPINSSEPDIICSQYTHLVHDGSSYIHIYYREELDIALACNWDIKEAIQGYFHFMGYKFNYRTWDISIYHGGIVQSSENIDLINANTKLLRVLHPFKPEQIESKSALPWCVDGLKWEFMRGYQLLCNKNWNELYHEATPPSAKEVYNHNMYTYISLY